MNLDPIISALLFEAESAELDFKSEQYSFEGVDDRVKSELLKDILAFSNAWRRSDAYILIGVKEVKEAESEVVGITKHIDDASLQEFVNSKTNRPVDFSYNPTSFRGKQIGVIHIPVQDRPTFLKRDFGKLRRNIVYLRRGSSTVEALPDEIARMGQAVSDGLKLAPILVPRLATSSDWSNLTEIETFEAVHLNSLEIKSLPDYSPPASTDLSGRTIYSVGRTNSDYFRDRPEYLRFSAKLRPIRFAVCNEGTAIASGVKLSSHVADPAHSLEFQLGSDRQKWDASQAKTALPMRYACRPNSASRARRRRCIAIPKAVRWCSPVRPSAKELLAERDPLLAEPGVREELDAFFDNLRDPSPPPKRDWP